MRLKYFKIFSKIIYILFFVLTATMLIFAMTIFNQNDVEIPGMFYFGIFFLLIFYITLITIVVDFIITMKRLTEVFNVKLILKRACFGAIVGVAIIVLLSLIKYHELFSADFIYLLIVCPILSLFSLFLDINNK